MSIQYALNPEVTPELEAGILRLWAEVTNAGGAVGFVPPVDTENIRAVSERHLHSVRRGESHLLLGRDDAGEVAGLAFLHLNSSPLMRHWLWLYRVMVHPGRQGGGEGRRLMDAAADAARDLPAIRGIRLTCRGGMGLERFYESCGYKEIGRAPDALLVSEGDVREEITLWLPL
jgi:GNAT superfamily N-acetyltransferase